MTAAINACRPQFTNNRETPEAHNGGMQLAAEVQRANQRSVLVNVLVCFIIRQSGALSKCMYVCISQKAVGEQTRNQIHGASPLLMPLQYRVVAPKLAACCCCCG
jgi:hypothetical protein